MIRNLILGTFSSFIKRIFLNLNFRKIISSCCHGIFVTLFPLAFRFSYQKNYQKHYRKIYLIVQRKKYFRKLLFLDATNYIFSRQIKLHPRIKGKGKILEIFS
jgi:hypothetical protein